MRHFFLMVLACLGFIKPIMGDEPVYTAKDFSALLEMPLWSQDLLKMHFTLYQGYVKNTNLLSSKLKELNDNHQSKSYEFGALKRRFGWEFDGMRLHELYFENLSVTSIPLKEDSLLEQINRDFGSFEAWKEDFIATGLIRGIGWVILYKDPSSGKLFNAWINEHDVGHLALGVPLLVMDVFEHAYITQFGLDRAKYIDQFFQNLNWQVIVERFLHSTKKS
jgi:Fe-Mn family superoxide dismutase